MKGGSRIALGVGIGYVLGRTRKMRFALSLAGAAMAKRSAGTPGDLLERGTSLLKSPELTKITDTVRGELMGAARAAAVTAASNRIDALNSRLQQGSTILADADRRRSRETDSDEDAYDEPAEDDEQAASADDDEQAASADDEHAASADDDEQAASADDDLEDEYEEDEDDTDQPADEDDTERPAARPRARRSSTAARRAASSRSEDRGSAERKPSGVRGRRSRADAGEAPVRRTRR
ncbi:hypothetical protein IU486_01835 [Streptomyces gardneri]|uniref:hypothetical protein n=1 Tax=Nocardia sputi TaxID=2943705 RepID=UPI001895663E|nr:hypothetical protein [Nocardia sputi]MBF6163512.1 hypothetical protein [Streptomyces gardneri]MBF6202516.1 hypothetical protein [Streptomyces gardneri]